MSRTLDVLGQRGGLAGGREEHRQGGIQLSEILDLSLILLCRLFLRPACLLDLMEVRLAGVLHRWLHLAVCREWRSKWVVWFAALVKRVLLVLIEKLFIIK